MTAERTPVTAKQAMFTFYDIESLSNAFSLVAYTPRTDTLDTLEVFFLADNEELAAALDPQRLYETIVTSNPGLPQVAVKLWNLHTEVANHRLATIVGLSDAPQVGNRWQASSYPDTFRPVCDTDEDYDPTHHPFLAGYNSLNYDTVMLALYLEESFPNPHNGLVQPTTAGKMRRHNDALFSDENIKYMPKYLGWDRSAAKIRKAMLHSGRHLDVAKLNELQHKVSLKRLLGMLGHQIKESDRLSHDSTITEIEDLYELLAYNVSDCLGLAQLFAHSTYSSAFDLKVGLLEQFSETVYARDGQIRRDRLTIDTTSAKFVGRILSPHGTLDDIETVSFDYPHPAIAAERGIEPVNVLAQCKDFFETEIVPDRESNPAQAEAHRRFLEVYEYYHSIEGKNFNDSEEYGNTWPSSPAAVSLDAIPKRPNNLPYFHADGSASSCFATFSTGGIHGAEVDTAVFSLDRLERLEQENMLLRARQVFPDPLDFRAQAKSQHDLLTLPDGSTVDKARVLSGSDPEKVKYRKPKKDDEQQNEQLARAQAQVGDPADLLATQRDDSTKLDVVLADGTVLIGKVVLEKISLSGATYREEPAKKKPELFVANKDGGSTKLHPKYVHTSAGHVIHEDFTSYYPNLLRNMRAFYNPELGEDRYAKIFFDKERYGKQMKAPGISESERIRLNTLRNGTKLILNSASGAGDTTFTGTPIRMNNQIISMRLIGQLFSWRIGQAQTHKGARIISTNTDGLYSILDVETNNRVLAEQSAAIGIDIEPEPMFLISKDSNNRLELVPPRAAGVDAALTEWEIAAAGGGTLACHGGPRPDKALAHPAVIDFALARYLQTVASRGEEALTEDFDADLGCKIMDEALDVENPVRTAMLFQNVMAASRGSITYPFSAAPIEAAADDDKQIVIREPRALQMVNRAFVVRPGTPGAMSLHNAGAWVVTDASQNKRRMEGLQDVQRDPVALEILRHHGWAKTTREAAAGEGLSVLPENQDVVTRRINGIDPTWSMIVRNDDLHVLDRGELTNLIKALDLEVYTQMLDETFTKNWKNAA